MSEFPASPDVVEKRENMKWNENVIIWIFLGYSLEYQHNVDTLIF